MAETKPLSFIDLMAIEPLRKNTETYVNKRPAFDSLGMFDTPFIHNHLESSPPRKMFFLSFDLRNGLHNRWLIQHTNSWVGNSTGYGGHVYAQSVWAASQTVDRGMVVHVNFQLFVLMNTPSN
jgi:hypothetical protein